MDQIIQKIIIENGVPMMILAAIFWFVVGKLWPFFVTQVWPATLRSSEARIKATQEQTSTLVRLEASQQIMVQLLEKQIEMLWKLSMGLAGINMHADEKKDEVAK